MSYEDEDEVGGVREWFIKTLKKTIMFFLLSVSAFALVTLALYYSSEILALTQYAKDMLTKPP